MYKRQVYLLVVETACLPACSSEDEVRAGPPICDLPLKARIGTHAEPADCAVAKREEGKDMEETARKERLAGQRVIPVLVDCLVLYRKHAKQASQLKDRTTSSTNVPRHDLSDKERSRLFTTKSLP